MSLSYWSEAINSEGNNSIYFLPISANELKTESDQITKECNTCHKLLPLKAFAPNRMSPDKKHHRCLECGRAERRAFWQAFWQAHERGKEQRNMSEQPALTTIKQCSRCKQLLSLDAFSKDSHEPDGRQHWCKACMSNHRKEKGATRTDPLQYPSMARCGRRFKNNPGKATHEMQCDECRKLARKEKDTMTKQLGEFICLSRCQKAFENPQERDAHERICIDCMEIEQSIPPLSTELPFDKDEYMETDTPTDIASPVASNGHYQEALISEVSTEPRQSEAISMQATPRAQPLLVRVGSYLVAISQIVLIDVRKDNTVDVITSALQVTNQGRTESRTFNLPETEGTALIASLEPITTSAPSGILEKLRGQNEEMRAKDQKIHDLEFEVERLIKERESAMDIALKADEELNRYKSILSQLR